MKRNQKLSAKKNKIIQTRLVFDIDELPENKNKIALSLIRTGILQTKLIFDFERLPEKKIFSISDANSSSKIIDINRGKYIYPVIPQHNLDERTSHIVI